MWSKFWSKLTTTLTGGAIIIATASVASRLLGLIRDRLLASHFGAGNDLDAYYAAFRIPDLVFNVLVLGALSAALIPVFVQYIQKAQEQPDKRGDVWYLANSLLNTLLIGLVLFGLIFFVFAPQLVPLIAPGFTPEKQLVTVKMTRIMLVSILFFGASNIITGILNSFKRYVNFAFAPVMYNVGIILGIVFLVPKFGVYGLAYGVVVGAFLHCLIQIPAIWRLGYRYRPILDMHHEGVRTVGRLMVPRTFGLAVTQIDTLISTIIASTLAVGSVAVINFANNLQSFPISVFGVSLAVASYPFLSEAFAQKNHQLFVEHFSRSFRRILFLILPTSVLILVLRAQIVRVVLGTGQFDWNDTYLTAQALGFFALSLFAQSTIPLLTRSFYAHHDTKTPVKIGIITVIIDIVGALILSRYLHVVGIALAFSISNFVNMVLLLVILRRRFGYLDDQNIIKSTLKIVLISAAAGGAAVAGKYILVLGIDQTTFVGILIQGVGAGLIGLIVYLFLAVVMRCQEIGMITDWILRTKHQLLNGRNNT